MLARPVVFVPPALAVCLLLAACNTDAHFTSTPYIDQDFKLPPEHLSRTFFDVDRYEEVTVPFFAFFEMPPVNELKYACYFGPPAEEGFSWWNLVPLFAVPPFCPCKTLVWRRGDYRFRAQVAYPLIYWFKPHLWYWKVEWVPPGWNPGEPQVVALRE